MKQSFVKMMNRISEIENCILKGLVLDEHGNWVTIADRKAVEEDSLAHLAAGQVLFEGRWVNFTEVKSSRTRSVERPPLFGGIAIVLPRKKKSTVETPAATAPAVPVPPPPPVKTPEPVGTPPETAIIIQTPAPEEEARTARSSPVKSPPETAIIVELPTRKNETPAAEQAPTSPPPPARAAADEEYAPETKIILFKPPPESSPPAAGKDTSEMFLTDIVTGATVEDEDTHIFLRPASVPLVESGYKRKRNILLVGGAIVVLAGIAAILTIVFQSAQ
jgi:hypothetical protein